MMKKKSFTEKINIVLVASIILFFNFITLSPAKADYCSDLYNYLTNSTQYIDIIGKKDSKSYRFGFDVEYDVSLENIDQWMVSEEGYLPYKRTEEGYINIGNVDLDGPFYNNEFLISPGDIITKIDGIDTSTITDKEFDDILALKDEHTFEFYLWNDYGREDLIQSLSSYFVTTTIKRDNLQDVPTFYSAVVPIDLMEINTKDNEYILNYHQWISMGLGTHLFPKDFPVPENIDNAYYKLCSYASVDDNYFEKFKITDPILKFSDKVEDISTTVNEFSIYVPTKDFFYDDDYSIDVDFFSDKTSKFVTLYDLKLFPFDTQYISDFYEFHYTNFSFGHHVLGANQSYYAWELLENHFTPGFDLINIDYWNYVDTDFLNRDSNNRYFFEIEIKRQNFYHIAKILIPIFLILILSWSSFWIKSKEIEAKLTVTIICFLTLIAYNFVIDSDLPRLDYLTWLDYYILLSYVFCGLTTFTAIYEYHKVINRKKINNLTQTIKSVGIPTFLVLNILSFYLIKFSIFYDF